MKVKTIELEGPALDWAVAKAAGYKPSVYSTQSIRAELPTGGVIAPFMPGFRWDQGGPILERERIGPRWDKLWNQWGVPDPKNAALGILGQTFLITAMRCFVTSRLGDKVEVPDELMACSNREPDASQDQANAQRPRSRA